MHMNIIDDEVLRLIITFMTNELSSFYLDFTKMFYTLKKVIITRDVVFKQYSMRIYTH